MSRTIEIQFLDEGYVLGGSINSKAIESPEVLIKEVAQHVLQYRTTRFIKDTDVFEFLAKLNKKEQGE